MRGVAVPALPAWHLRAARAPWGCTAMGILHSRESTKEPTKKVRRTHDADSSVKRSAAGALEDNYAVDPKVLGRGHYGVVRKCVNRATGEKCAVKAIPRAKIHRPEVLEREISILKNLKWWVVVAPYE